MGWWWSFGWRVGFGLEMNVFEEKSRLELLKTENEFS